MAKTKRKTNKDWYEECYYYERIDPVTSCNKYAGKMLIGERDREKGLRAIVIDPDTLKILHEAKISLKRIINFNRLAEIFEFRERGPDYDPVLVQYLLWRKEMMKK